MNVKKGEVNQMVNVHLDMEFAVSVSCQKIFVQEEWGPIDNLMNIKSEQKKMGHIQKFAINKKSTIFVLFS